MKKLLTHLLWIGLLISVQWVQAQTLYRLGPPAKHITSSQGFANLFYGYARPSQDTTMRMIQVTETGTGKKLLFVQLTCVNDSLRAQPDCVVSQTLIYDTLTERAFARQDAFPYQAYRLTLVQSALVQDDAPIEDSLLVEPPPADTSLHQSDSAHAKKFPVSIHGSITVIGQLSDNKNLGQTIPQNYLRTYINTNVDLFGLPFNIGYVYTTESNSGLNKMNNFKFAFDYQQFHQNLTNKLKDKIGKETNLNIRNPQLPDIKELDKEYEKLNAKLTNTNYLKEIEKNRQILEKGATDSLFRQSYRFKKAAAKLKQHDFDAGKLKELTGMKDRALKELRNVERENRIKGMNLDKPGTFKTALKKYGLYKGNYDLMLSIKRFELGTFDPNYSSLVLSGVSLTGVNTEINAGYLYGAFVWGSTVSNFSNPFSFDISGSRTIMAGRVGVGRTEKMLLAFTVLKGDDHSGNTVSDSGYTYYNPMHNYVLGASLTYKLNDIANIELEYASTQNVEIDQSTKASESYQKMINNNRKDLSNAWSAKFNMNFKESNTKLYLMTRQVDPYYYSFGTPYLRKDDWRVEAKADQGLWKKQLTASVTYRHDEDNIYGLKENTSENNTFIFTSQLRIKKYPFLILTYAPSYQKFYNSVNHIHMNTSVKMYSITAGYTKVGRSTVSTTVFTYLKQYNSSSSADISLFHVDQYTASENVLIRTIDLNLNGSVSYILPRYVQDTGKVFISDVSAGMNMFHKKVNITGGYAYQKDFGIEVRNIIYATLGYTFPFQIKVSIRAEHHFIHHYQELKAKDNMNLGRITITKYF